MAAPSNELKAPRQEPAAKPPVPGKQGVPGHTAVAKDASKRTYTVEDANAARHHVARTHSIKVPIGRGKMDFREFTFKPGEHKEMPQEQALLFLEIDPSFVVRNSRGAIIRPRSHKSPGDRLVEVKAHEMVVPLTAVLKTYLVEIAQTLPGGERFAGNPESFPREEIEEFIITGGKVEDEDLLDDEDAE